jgi:Secretion system C-terminal sorting domain
MKQHNHLILSLKYINSLNMKKIYTLLFVVFVTYNTNAQCNTNYLINPSFETPIQPSLGNNFPAPYNVFGGWSILTASPTVQIGGFNVVKVDGSGYSGGPNTAHGTGNQYVDINGAGGFVQQTFTVTCGSTIEYSGWFSRREPGGNGFNGYMDLLDGSNNPISTSTTVSFTSNESEEVWKQVIGTSVSVLPGTYTIRFFMDDYANVDDAFLCVNPGCVLSTKINDINASSNNCSNTLNWISENESNLKNYEIQKSEDGIKYNTISTVVSTKQNNISKYTITDKALSTNSYYRLKINESDNTFSYSKSITVTSTCDFTKVSVYPNPTTDIINVNISNNKRKTALIFNATGKKVAQSNLINGNNIVDIKSLPKGVYVVKVMSDTESKVFRITKL